VDAGPCPEPDLLCRYEGHPTRVCCDGAWRTAECAQDGDSEVCACPTVSGGQSTCTAREVFPVIVGDSNCGLDACQDGRLVTPTFSADALPEGAGGAITLGTYVLVELVVDESGDCFPSVGTDFAQTLRLGREYGWLARARPNAVAEGVTFEYRATGAEIAFDILCGEASVPTAAALERSTARHGPFGPYETYTATADTLELYSPTCGYRAAFERIAD